MSFKHVIAGKAGTGACKRRPTEHYRRMQKLAIAKLPDQAIRFWAKINKTEGCWEWSGAHTVFGHGIFRWNGRNQIASRIIWQLIFGEIPAGLNVLHNCPEGDNPKCCNPAHLFLGTKHDNSQDMVKKGRTNGPKGIRNASAKLTDEKVREIKASTEHRQALAGRFGVTAPVIDSIRARRTWKHVI